MKKPAIQSAMIMVFIFSAAHLAGFAGERVTSAGEASTDEITSYLSGLPFVVADLKVPVFAERVFDIRDFGAVGDGLTLNTKAINRAIQECARAGGGRVSVPAGIWLTGPIFMESHVELHLHRQALLLFSRNFDDYPLIETIFEGTMQYRCTSPINAVNLQNIAVTGRGVIDGSGDAWRPVKRFKMTGRNWQELLTSGGVVNKEGTIWYPTLSALNGEDHIAVLAKKNIKPAMDDVRPVKDYLRPVMVRLVGCSDVLLDGPTFQNSPAWNIHPIFCENVIIRNITVRNPWYAQNGDGLDLESCKNVLVYDSVFDVGDDAVCLKSGKDEEGRRRGRPTENIVIRNCTVYHGHGGFTIGSEMSGGVRNVFVGDCTFIGTDVGLRFKSTRGRGGAVEKIYLRNIRMQDIRNEAILFDLFYAGNPSTDHNLAMIPEIGEGTPRFGEIYFENIFCRNAARAVLFNGLPEMPLQDIKLDSLVMTGADGIRCSHVRGVRFSRAHIISEKTPVFHLIHSRDVEIAFGLVPVEEAGWLRVEGRSSADIRLFTVPDIDPRKAVSCGEDVSRDAVVIIRGSEKK